MTTQAAAPMTRRDLETKIIVKAWEDEAFRTRFLAEPKAMFEERLGVKLPETLTITAHAEDAEHLHFVIPAKPDIDFDELSDEDLEKIAGGTLVEGILLVGTILTSLATIAGALSLLGMSAAVSVVIYEQNTGNKVW